jgi:hypothetical protein
MHDQEGSRRAHHPVTSRYCRSATRVDCIGQGSKNCRSEAQLRRGVSSMVEQRTFNPWVQGSSPWRPTRRSSRLSEAYFHVVLAGGPAK